MQQACRVCPWSALQVLRLQQLLLCLLCELTRARSGVQCLVQHRSRGVAGPCVEITLLSVMQDEVHDLGLLLLTD
jgi:hypothetical protein